MAKVISDSDEVAKGSRAMLAGFSMATDAETRPTDTTDKVVAAEPRPIETTDEVVVAAEQRPIETTGEVVAAEPRATEITGEVVGTESRPTETTDEVVTTETRRTDKNDEVVETKTRPTSDEIGENDTRPTDTSAEVEQTERRPDLVWDAEASGLCVRVYGDGAKSFIFVYRIGDRQRFIGIGRLRCGRWRLPEPGRRNCERSLTRAATQRAKIADVRSRRSRISSNTSPRTLCRSHNCQERALGPNVRQPSCSPATRRGGAKRPQVPIRAWGSFCGGKPAS